MRRWSVYCLVLLATATVCLAGMKVDFKSYAEVDLSAHSTYRWSTDQEADSGHPLATGSPLDRRLQAIAGDLLAKRGLAPAGDGEPDLLIHCIAISKEAESIGGVKKEMVGGVTWVGDVGAHGFTAYRQGTLINELKDAELTWETSNRSSRDLDRYNKTERGDVNLYYIPGRRDHHVLIDMAGEDYQVLGDYDGVMICDGYKAYDVLAREPPGSRLRLAHCWAHVRRKFLEAEPFFISRHQVSSTLITSADSTCS